MSIPWTARRSRRCRKETRRRSKKSCCKRQACRKDSTASGNLHIRNEHANVQYRVDGILLPDGVSGFSQLMETSFAGSMALVTGALPAQYGLRTSALVDIVSRAPPTTPGGSVTLYGGSHGTGQTVFDYGAKIGQWEVFAAGRLVTNNLGIENPTSSYEAIHDRTRQGRFFGFLSYAIDDATKLSFITGTSVANYQIPNNPGQQPGFEAFGISNFDSAKLNENQVERSYYNVVALTHAGAEIDTQLSFFSRYSELHFVPDEVGDLVFNGVSSDIYRSSFVNGLQGDGAYRVGGGHTLRAGFTASGERRKPSIPRSSSRWTPMAIRSTRRSASANRIPSSAGSPASMCRTSGRSPTG